MSVFKKAFSEKAFFFRLLVCAFLMAACGGQDNHGFVWLDENANGVQDEGEPGVANVKITVYTKIDNSIYFESKSNVDGFIELPQVPDPPQYKVIVTLKSGYEFTLIDQGFDDEIDSDVLPSTGELVTDAYTDIGLVQISGAETPAQPGDIAGQPGVVSGFAWIDTNTDGIQDEDEPPLPGVAVNLLMGVDKDLLQETTTGADGQYLFEDVALEQTYSVSFAPPSGYAGTLQFIGGNATLDSDPDPLTGQSLILALTPLVTSLDIDAGFVAGGGGAAAAPDVCYGPLAETFPAGYSPLSGLPVSDPTLLSYRPVFLSISIFPPSVRPPTGLAVSPIIYQLYIGDGDTRLMAGFYGEFPQPDFAGSTGEGSGAPEGFDLVIGDRVWFDSNGNHLQDSGEPGVADVPVSLLDINLNTVQTTTTDALGNYYFGLDGVAANTEFQVRFGAPPSISDYYWVNKDMGDDAIDSDVTAQGRTDFFDPTDAGYTPLNLDAGLRQAYRIEGLRSGRVAYQDLQVNYCGCLVTAGADPTVASLINTCGSAFGEDPNNIGGAGLDVTRLQSIAANNTEGSCSEPNLSGNLFCTNLSPEEFPSQAGQELFVEYNVNNISHFEFDAALNAYKWGLVVPGTQDFEVMTDRLTGETLSFENVVVLVVPHKAQNSAVTIINLEMSSARGKAYLFRNGQMYELEWSTQFPAYITDRDQPIPVHFELNGEPFPLAPGQTFINLVNVTGGVMSMMSDGIWGADFDAPAYTP